MWDDLPSDIVALILTMRNTMRRRDSAAIRMQRVWRAYRVRMLIGRYRMLRYLQVFHHYNPSLEVFLRRARL